MNVECLAQMADRHGGALNMPARPPRPPGAVPGGLSRLRPFPECKVHGMALSRIDFDTRPGLHLIELSSGEHPIAGKRRDVKIHVRTDWVGDILFDERLDQCDDFVHMFRGFRLKGRQPHAQPFHIAMVGINVADGNCLPGHSLLLRALDSLVIDVRKVFNKRLLEIQMLQISTDDSKDDCTARMSQMTLIVDGDAADIHPHPAGLERRKKLLAAGHTTEDVNCAHWMYTCWIDGESAEA